MRTGRLAGHYYMMLGTFVVLGIIAGSIMKNSLRIDLSFILYFWIGIGLLNARSGRWKLAIVLNALSLLFCAGFIGYVISTGRPIPQRGALMEPQLAAFNGVVLIALLLPPLILLLLPATRRWFAQHRQAPPPRYSLTARVIVLYILAACFPIGAVAVLERSVRTAVPSSQSGGFEYGDGKRGISAAGWMEDKETRRPLRVSWLAFAEDANSYSSKPDGHVTFGDHRVAVPDDQPVKYLFAPFRSEESRAHVLMVRKDGTVIRLERRIAPDHVEPALEAVRGVRDFEELQKRLEALLPAY